VEPPSGPCQHTRAVLSEWLGEDAPAPGDDAPGDRMEAGQ